MQNCILVTGGAGFIGSNFIRKWMIAEDSSVVNLDKLTYAGNPQNIGQAEPAKYSLIVGDINDRGLVRELLASRQPKAIIHFAAESHVDRSILDPDQFIKTNVCGTFSLLEESRSYWKNLGKAEKDDFRFLHVSTDEVYGSLEPHTVPFSEAAPFAPNSPYAASKAASDHFVRAYGRTYGFPTLTTNCSNNYGPYQFPEKLIPVIILNALSSQLLPVYGDGLNVRDWLYVEDHCDAIRMVLARGNVGETFNIGGGNEKTNFEVVTTICALLDSLRPRNHGSYGDLIQYVPDRPGHDRRYAIDAGKVERELSWTPSHSFEEGLLKTVQWYLEHTDWVEEVKSGSYQQWIQHNYKDREATCGA